MSTHIRVSLDLGLERLAVHSAIRHHGHPKLLDASGIINAASRCLAHVLHRFNNLFDIPRRYLGAAHIDDIGSAPDEAQNSVISKMPNVSGIEPLVRHGATLEVDIREEARRAIADDAVTAIRHRIARLVDDLDIRPRRNKADRSSNSFKQVEWPQ